MPTYTKETALYDTGAIKTGIDGAAETASKYITTVGNTGIKVHPYNESSGQADANNYSKIDSTGMDVVSDGTSRAKFGASTRIGKETGESRVLIDYHSLQLVDKEGEEYFYVSDLRDSSGLAVISEVFYATSDDQTQFSRALGFTATDVVNVIFNGTPLTQNDYHVQGGVMLYLDFSTPIGSKVIITYRTQESSAKAYTMGTRASDGSVTPIGAYSVGIGYGVTASGTKSIAIGDSTSAIAEGAYAEGYQTMATGVYSHAEGSGTEARGAASHAEGEGCIAATAQTHASGEGTYADQYNQTAIGRYNTKNNANSLFVVGNGTSDTARSDAFAVYQNGTTEVKGHLLVGGTITVRSKPLLTTRTVSVDNISIVASASSAYSQQQLAVTSVTGYTPIGVISWAVGNASSSGVGASWVSAYQVYLDGDHVNFYVRNHMSSQAKVKLTATVLYANTGII